MSGVGTSLEEIYRLGARILRDANIEDPEYESLCLMEYFFSADRSDLIIHGAKQADKAVCVEFFAAVKERADGRPLQYILGMWTFMGLDFFVGEGVLIPRCDTEIVTEMSVDFLREIERPRVIDLCSGSGAIAVTIAKEFPGSSVVALELSDMAIEYLEKNIRRNGTDNVSVWKGDVTSADGDFPDGPFDLIVANPPYIATDEINTLQRELQAEPRIALDGGRDGLYYYREITKLWSGKVKPGGMLAFEVGEGQYEPVARMLEEVGFTDITYRPDIQGIRRALSGRRKIL